MSKLLEGIDAKLGLMEGIDAKFSLVEAKLKKVEAHYSWGTNKAMGDMEEAIHKLGERILELDAQVRCLKTQLNNVENEADGADLSQSCLSLDIADHDGPLLRLEMKAREQEETMKAGEEDWDRADKVRPDKTDGVRPDKANGVGSYRPPEIVWTPNVGWTIGASMTVNNNNQ